MTLIEFGKNESFQNALGDFVAKYCTENKNNNWVFIGHKFWFLLWLLNKNIFFKKMYSTNIKLQF